MSKCMVAYIDWYHERMDGEGGREKIKVDIKDGWSGQGAPKSEKVTNKSHNIDCKLEWIVEEKYY